MNMPKPPATPKYSDAQAATVSMNNVKAVLMNAVIGTLYDDVLHDLHVELGQIAAMHCVATGTMHPSFEFCGKYYNMLDEAAPYPLPLDPSLHTRMRDYLAEHHQVNNYEIPCIKGILTSMFIASDRIDDYKLVLPEAVHGAFDYVSIPPPRRFMMPAEIDRLKKRIAPFIGVMKGRMLNNRLTNRGQP